MLQGKRLCVVMPAFNAAKTLHRTYAEVLATGIVDRIVVVDDASTDQTVSIAKGLPGVHLQVHAKNGGYGANQKTCYTIALEQNADIVIMVHPDYQYTPKLIPAMAHLIANGVYHCVLGSRILGGYALKGGMPLWKYMANRGLTFVENLLLSAKLSEYHTGYRAFSRELLERVPWNKNSDDFVFDNQILAQIIWAGFQVAEISCPTLYFGEASSINFRRSVKYGFGSLGTALLFRAARTNLVDSRLFEPRKTAPRAVEEQLAQGATVQQTHAQQNPP